MLKNIIINFFPGFNDVGSMPLRPEAVSIIFGGMLVAVIVFIIYGCIVGFKNTLVNEPPPGGGADPN